MIPGSSEHEARGVVTVVYHSNLHGDVQHIACSMLVHHEYVIQLLKGASSSSINQSRVATTGGIRAPKRGERERASEAIEQSDFRIPLYELRVRDKRDGICSRDSSCEAIQKRSTKLQKGITTNHVI